MNLIQNLRDLGIEVSFDTLVPEMMFLEDGHDDAGVPRRLIWHSEAFFFLFARGVRFHVERWGCPTWSDATEFRCDVEVGPQ